jgi:REP element-mobilizing transposase RayT
MAKTYSQILIQIVFSVKGMANLIRESFKDELEKYICGIFTNKKAKVYAIYANPDHVHILISIPTDNKISDLVRDIKANSSKFINEKKFVAGKFELQIGYCAFSYSLSQIDAVVKYINNQKEHHKKKNFKEEYLDLLQKIQIEFDDKYLFEWIEF